MSKTKRFVAFTLVLMMAFGAVWAPKLFAVTRAEDAAQDGTATITLRVDEGIWSDNTGYQLYLDSTADTYGRVFDEDDSYFNQGNIPDEKLAEFERTIPENLDGQCSGGTDDVVRSGEVTITVKAGKYDWAAVSLSERNFYFITDYKTEGGTTQKGFANDYEFLAGYHYDFHVYSVDPDTYSDGLTVTAEKESTEPVEPSEKPTEKPSENPTEEPSENPTEKPSEKPSENPTSEPVVDVTGWSFESEDEVKTWTIKEDDNDEHNWRWLPDGGINHSMIEAVDGMGVMVSESHDYDTRTPLAPQNWLISPTFRAAKGITFYLWVPYNGYTDHVGVYISTDGGATWEQKTELTIENSSPKQYSVSTEKYEGRNIKLAFFHHDTQDQLYVVLDDVRITGESAPNTESPNTQAPETQAPETQAPETQAPVTEPPEGTAYVVLKAGDYFSDGSGYQILFDKNHDTYGKVASGNGGYVYRGSTNAAEFYGQFESTIPSGLSGDYSKDEVVLTSAGVQIEIPSGIYDYFIVNPVPSDSTIYLAYDYGPVGGCMNDFVIEPNKTYEFYVKVDESRYAQHVELRIDGKLYGEKLPELENGWGFEHDPKEAGWEVRDDDHDDRSWLWMEYGLSAPEGHGVMISQSYIKGVDGLKADNWLISPKFTADDKVTFSLADMFSGFTDSVDVYVVTKDGEWNKELSVSTYLGEYGNYEFDTTGYKGTEIQVAFRHYNSVSGVGVKLDLVRHESGRVAESPTVPPRPTLEPGAESIVWDFETEAEIDGWELVDYDRDGFNWMIYPYEECAYRGTNSVISMSWNEVFEGPKELTPDNWLITPSFKCGGLVTFYICAIDKNYPGDSVGVYVSTDGGTKWSKELGHFVCTAEYKQCVVELDDYIGEEIVIGFRHHEEEQFCAVALDTVEVSVPHEETPAPVTESPTANPPTDAPTDAPTDIPTEVPTEAPVQLPGDVDGDGEIKVDDALKTARCAMGLTNFDDGQKAAADMDGDEKISMNDALAIIRRAMDLIKS